VPLPAGLQIELAGDLIALTCNSTSPGLCIKVLLHNIKIAVNTRLALPAKSTLQDALAAARRAAAGAGRPKKERGRQLPVGEAQLLQLLLEAEEEVCWWAGGAWGAASRSAAAVVVGLPGSREEWVS
jgi:hypothetical protein